MAKEERVYVESVCDMREVRVLGNFFKKESRRVASGGCL